MVTEEGEYFNRARSVRARVLTFSRLSLEFWNVTCDAKANR